MARSDLSNRCKPLRDVVPNNSDLNIVNEPPTAAAMHSISAPAVNSGNPCLCHHDVWVRGNPASASRPV
jgi:hypothetical protein